MRTNDCVLGSSLDGDYHINLNHIVEKDGIVSVFLILEAMAYYKQNLNLLYSKISEEILN